MLKLPQPIRYVWLPRPHWSAVGLPWISRATDQSERPKHSTMGRRRFFSQTYIQLTPPVTNWFWTKSWQVESLDSWSVSKVITPLRDLTVWLSHCFRTDFKTRTNYGSKRCVRGFNISLWMFDTHILLKLHKKLLLVEFNFLKTWSTGDDSCMPTVVLYPNIVKMDPTCSVKHPANQPLTESDSLQA